LIGAAAPTEDQIKADQRKGPTSKIYLAEIKGDIEIENNGKIYPGRQAQAFNAPASIFITKKDSHVAAVYSNGTGLFIDQNTRTDETIYVCRFNRAYRKHIRLYIKQLKESKNELLGIVLNGLSTRRIEYYSNYRYYRSYKKYYGSQS
jgi:hypothetical protein